MFSHIRSLWSGLRALLRPAAADRELTREVAAHLTLLEDEYRRRGLGPDEARRAARLAIGGPEQAKELHREARALRWLHDLQRDVRYSWRGLLRTPAFTITSVVVLALGVGLNLAVFHVVKAVFYDSLRVPDAESLVRLIRQSPDGETWRFPAEAVAFYDEHADLFTHVVGERLGVVPVQLEAGNETARAQFVSGNYFDDLRIAPLIGRLLGPGDDQPGAPLVAVVSEGYWQRRFGGDPALVSSTVILNDQPVRVAGILPEGFVGLAMSRGDFWFAAAVRPRLLGELGEADGTSVFGPVDTGIVGRLRPGVSLEAASAQLTRLTAELRSREPGAFGEPDDRETARVRPLAEDNLNRDPYVVLGPLVALVLLAACANLGNMLLARGVARRREIETRMAIGAGRWRLVRQLMTESLVLAGLGALGGLVVGRVAAPVLTAIFTGQLNIRVTTDLRVIAVAGLLSLLSAVVFGLAPALQLTSGPTRLTRSRQTLVAVQVAVSCVLLILAGLLVRGAQRQTTIASSTDFASLIVIDVDLVEAGLSGPAARQLLEDVAERVRRVPGAAAVTISADPIYGVRAESAPGLPFIARSAVDPDYFRVMQLDVVRGRTFRPGDRDVAVISASAARAAFDDDDPIGRTWNPGGGATGPAVIGVVENSALASLRDLRTVEMYVPFTGDANAAPGSGSDDVSVLVRAAGDPGDVLRDVRDATALPGLTRTIWVVQTPVDQLLQHSIAATRVLGVLGGTASALAAFGLFGLVAFSVRERTREIAVRMALGARTGEIAGALLRQYAMPVGIGMVIGMGLAAAGERVFGAMRAGLGLTTFDPAGYMLGLAVFSVTAAAAILVPLRRTARIDPSAALRSE